MNNYMLGASTDIKILERVFKFKLRFLVWLGLKMGTALGIIFVVHSVRTSPKVHLVDLRVRVTLGTA